LPRLPIARAIRDSRGLHPRIGCAQIETGLFRISSREPQRRLGPFVQPSDSPSRKRKASPLGPRMSGARHPRPGAASRTVGSETSPVAPEGLAMRSRKTRAQSPGPDEARLSDRRLLPNGESPLAWQINLVPAFPTWGRAQNVAAPSSKNSETRLLPTRRAMRGRSPSPPSFSAAVRRPDALSPSSTRRRQPSDREAPPSKATEEREGPLVHVVGRSASSRAGVNCGKRASRLDSQADN